MQTGKIICYWLNGQPIGLILDGNRWWKVTANERLELLDVPIFRRVVDVDEEKIHYLCEAGSTLHVTQLARMMGCALEDPDGDIEKELEDRLRGVKDQGVTVSEEPGEMNLLMRVCKYEDDKGERKVSIWCRDRDRIMHDLLFFINDFDDAPTAKHWGKVYADFFRKHGVTVNVEMEKG